MRTKAPLWLGFLVGISLYETSAMAQEGASAGPSAPTVGLLSWFALTAVVNTIAHFVTPVRADQWAEDNPRIARLCGVFRRAGIEPVALISDIYQFFAGNPPEPGLSRAIGRSYQRGTAETLVMTALAAVGISGVLACGILTPGTAATAITTIDGAACELAGTQSNEPTIERFICTILTGGAATQFAVEVPKEQAQAFAAAHKPASVR